MRRLGFPVRDVLRDVVDEAALQRIWREVEARFSAGARRRVTPVGAVVAAAVAAALVGAGIVLLAVARRPDAGPLHLADGHALVATDGTASPMATEIALSDGSRIELSRGARLEPLEASGTTFSAMLVRGSAEFDVRPGGPRRWMIECGLATVEVVGTRFRCERAPGHLRVKVERGTVLVRGERVPDRVRRLGAGESIDVVESRSGAWAGDHPEASPTSAGVTEVPRAPDMEPAVTPPAPLDSGLAEAFVRTGKRPVGAFTRRAPVSSPWRELARRGQNQEAFRALGADGVRREVKRLGVEDLLALADVARLSGHANDAVAPLERVLFEFARDPQAPLAAFALGRLELDALQQPARAVTAFERALVLGVPAGLREDVRARLVEACARAGDREATVQAAAAYAREFPNGRHARAIERWLSTP